MTIFQLPPRMRSKIKVTDTCWNWTGGKNAGRGGGYGRYFHEGRQVPSHRVTYTLLVGPIPDGMEIDHLCRNPACVNPEHLEPVERLENLRRGRPNWPRQNALKTRCKRGHPLEGDNLYVAKSGRRHCRACAVWRRQERRKSVSRG